jgi:hypothetical protein
MSASHDAPALPREPYSAGGQVMMIAAVLGVLGTIGWAAMLFTGGEHGTERAMYSWLWAFMFWLTPALGALGWLASFYAAKARWVILPRRSLEAIGNVVPVFVLLFIPIVLMMKTLYPWMNPEAADEESRRLFEHRAIWLNHGFFLVRACIYFAVFILVGHFLSKWSNEQDGGGKPMNTARAWRLGPGSLPVLGFSISFAAFDWMMSTSPSFYSSMFGLYIVGGAAMAAMAVWILVVIWARAPINGNHMHSMGKLMFAFMCFWGYTGFSQFMLIWIADIPDETPYFHQRIWTDWKYISWFLVIFHFILPFIILLSKRLKFSRVGLSTMAIWLLVVHAVDLYWIVLPQFSGCADGPHVTISDIAAFVGIGGISIAFLIFRMRGKNLVAIGDPFLASSMEYHP